MQCKSRWCQIKAVKEDYSLPKCTTKIRRLLSRNRCCGQMRENITDLDPMEKSMYDVPSIKDLTLGIHIMKMVKHGGGSVMGRGSMA